MTTVSLAIPVYDSAKFLDELFACLRRLDPQPAEIVLLDDASTDDSLDRLHRFAETAPGTVRVFTNARNMGIAAAYNRLARETRSEFVHLLDADDLICEPDFYARLRPALQQDVDAAVTGLRSNARWLDRCSRLFGAFVPRHPPTWWPLLGSFATRSGVIYRRARLLDVPFPDPAWPGSDVIHLLELRTGRRCTFLPAPHIHYRVHPDSQSSRQRDYSRYRQALAAFEWTIRLTHGADLALRGIGQRWMR